MGRATHDNAGIAANMDVKAKAKISSYEDCVEFLGSKLSKQLASNVRVEGVFDHYDQYSCGIFLYDTEIITYYSDGTFSVRNGGFNTPTTSRRVTQFTPDGYVFFHHEMMLTTRIDGELVHVEDVKLPVKRNSQ